MRELDHSSHLFSFYMLLSLAFPLLFQNEKEERLVEGEEEGGELDRWGAASLGGKGVFPLLFRFPFLPFLLFTCNFTCKKKKRKEEVKQIACIRFPSTFSKLFSF